MGNKIVGERICKLLIKLGWSNSEFSRRLYGNSNSGNRSKISKWLNAESNPEDTEIPKIAEVLGCSEAYLLGLDETISADNATINKVTGLLDGAIEGLKKLKQQIEEYANCNDPMLQSMYAIYENGFSYTDVISHIIGDVKLWETILYETERVITWHSSDDYRIRFEQLLNEDGSNTKFPSQIEIKEISNQIISKAISKSFNTYISDKLKELNIDELTASEHEQKLITNISKKK